MVVLSGINEDEVDRFIDFVRDNPNLVLQLIERMDFRDCDHHGDVKGIEDRIAAMADRVETRRMHHRKKYFVRERRSRSSGRSTTPSSAPTVTGSASPRTEAQAPPSSARTTWSTSAGCTGPRSRTRSARP